VDLNRFVPNDVSFDMASGFQPVVSVNSISVSSTPLSTAATRPNWTDNPFSLLGASQAQLFTIDSSTPFLWLPEKVCDAFARALNLHYNDTLQLYLYDNATDPSILADWNMTFTFTLADLPGSSKTIDITVPYDSFNHQLTFPFPALNGTVSSPAVNYFPLRKASNNTQYTIGRVFLQEAYLAVDYERNNFSISQAKFANNAVTNVKLAGITRPANSIFAGPKTSARGLSTGAIAGIGAGAGVLALAAMALAIFFCLRKRRTSQKDASGSSAEKKSFFKRRSNGDVKATVAEAKELLGDKRQPQEVAADRTNTRFELPGSAPVEMPADIPASYYAADKSRSSTPRAELEHHDSNAKVSLPPRNPNRVSQSTLPPYSPGQIGQRPRSNISPSSTLYNNATPGTGTMSSGISGISPNEPSHHHPAGHSSYGLRAASPVSDPPAISPPEPSPLLSPTRLDNRHENRSSLSLPRSRGGGRDEREVPSRSVSRGSRFREEGIAGETQRGRLEPRGREEERRFSWED
jgi:hypothetical protein